MTDPISQAVLAKLATQAIVVASKKVSHRLQDAESMRELRQQLYGSDAHTSYSSVFNSAIRKASFAQLQRSDVAAFLQVEDNVQIIASWLWAPEEVPGTIEQLDFTAGSRRRDKRNLQRFAEQLPGALDAAFQEAFPDAWMTIRSLRHEVQREHDKTRDLISSRADGHDDKLDHVADQNAVLIEVINRLEANQTDTLSAQVEEALRPSLDEIKALRSEGRIHDAIILAKQMIALVDKQSLGVEARCEAHRQASNCYLATLNRQYEAIPHLQVVASLTTNPSARHRNLALIALLEERVDDGLHDIEKSICLAEGDGNEDALKHAVLIKANLLSFQNKHEEALTVFSGVACKEATGDLFHLATFALRAGRYEQARKLALRVLSMDEHHADAHALFGHAVVLQQDASDRAGTPLDPKFRAILLGEGLSHLDEAIEAYGTQRPARSSFSLFNRGFIRIQLEDFHAAKDDFCRALELSPQSPRTLQNLCYVCLFLDDYKEGLEYLNKFKAQRNGPLTRDVLYLESSLLAGTEGSEAAVTYLEKVLATHTTPKEGAVKLAIGNERSEPATRLQIQLLLSRAYYEDRQSAKAEALLNQLRSVHPQHPRPLLELGIQKRRSGDFSGAIDLFEQVQDKAPAPLRGNARVLRAEAHYLRAQKRMAKNRGEATKDYEAAASVYGELADPKLPDSYLRRLALCIFRLGQFSDCLKICRKAQADGQIALFAELEALIYFNREWYGKAAKRYKWLASQFDGNIAFLLQYANCLYLLGKVDRAKGAVDQAAHRIARNDAEAHVIISRAYAQAGALSKAVHFGHSALRIEPNTPEYHQYYIDLFVLHGDRIQKDQAATEEHVKAYRECISDYEEHFPDRPYVYTRRIPEDPEELVRQFKEELPGPGATRTLDRILKDGHLPIGALSYAADRRIAHLWRTITEHPSYQYRAIYGARDSLSDEVAVAQDAPAIMVDLAPLLTLERLGLLDELKTVFSTIFISYAAYRELRLTIDREESQEGKERMALAAADEGLVMNTFPAASEDAWLGRLRSVERFLQTDSVRIAGKTVGRDSAVEVVMDNKNEGTPLQEMLGPSTAEALIESHVQGLTLYAEHIRFRDIARNRNIPTFGTRALLEVLLNRHVLPDFAYHEAILELIAMGFEFPIIQGRTVIYALDHDGYLRLRRSRLALSALSHPKSNPDNLFKVGAIVLIWLWRQPHGPTFVGGKPTLLSQVTWRVLDAVAGLAPRDLVPSDSDVTLRIKLTCELVKTVQNVLPAFPLSGLSEEFAETCNNWVRRTCN